MRPLAPEPSRIEVRLVHADAGCRVVRVCGYDADDRPLGSALAEAATVEAAEDQALQRLQRRLEGKHREPAAAADSPPATASPPPAAPEPVAPLPLAPPEPPADPDDWSEELAAIDAELRRIGWARGQEGTYLQRCFGHSSRNRITAFADLNAYLTSLRSLPEAADPDTSPVPLRRSDLIAQGEQLLQSLGWSADQGRQLLHSHFGAQSRLQLNDQQLLAFNLLLETEVLRSGGGPCD
jgi:hypothetical protein